MLHTRLVKALEKVGATVKEVVPMRHFVAELNGQRIDWYTQENFNQKLGDYDGQLYVSHTTSRHPDTDAMRDLFMDTFEHTIKGSVQLLTGN